MTYSVDALFLAPGDVVAMKHPDKDTFQRIWRVQSVAHHDDGQIAVTLYYDSVLWMHKFQPHEQVEIV